MKRLIILIFFLLLICIYMFNIKHDDSITVMSTENNSTHYELNFTKENLNLNNFKLKLGLFTSYDYNITKIYVKYNNKIKDKISYKKYFSFDNSNFNLGIEKLKHEYIVLLKENNLYDELDMDVNNILIEKVELYVTADAIEKFKFKYPNVSVKVYKY